VQSVVVRKKCSPQMASVVVAFVAPVEATNFAPEEKPIGQFRGHQDISNPRYELVRQTYEAMHISQTVESVRVRRAMWCRFDKYKMTMMDALFQLNALFDDSDPDVDVPNSFHAFQTAERIRQFHPDKDWFHLIGLIHDVGKVLALWGEPQWATVGDTYPVGCAPSSSVVFREQFDLCPDQNHPTYSTQQGIYAPNCGLDNVLMTWGHDEYLYQVLRHNNTTLPDEALYMIRYHSFYPWHTGGSYRHLTNEHDENMLPWVQEFNKFDLYSKCDLTPDCDALKAYYQTLIDKYCPGLLSW
jgi:inositol oxygenase